QGYVQVHTVLLTLTGAEGTPRTDEDIVPMPGAPFAADLERLIVSRKAARRGGPLSNAIAPTPGAAVIDRTNLQTHAVESMLELPPPLQRTVTITAAERSALLGGADESAKRALLEKGALSITNP